MLSDDDTAPIAVFDIGGSWFRWGLFDPRRGLYDCKHSAAISYRSHPQLTSEQLQEALARFLLDQLEELGAGTRIRTASISLGAPVNAHDLTVLGSGPLWGPSARPFQLLPHLRAASPEVTWHLINDVAALLACYTDDNARCHKTMLITVSTGIGSRLYDHRTARIPYDSTRGVQGEIGHLTCSFELDGRGLARQCECGGWNHVNAFSSGRGIDQTLRELTGFGTRYHALILSCEDEWSRASDAQRLAAFRACLDKQHPASESLLDALVTPLSRVLTTALCLDPDIDRIIMTGGVARGFGQHYRDALQRTFLRDGLYQISEADPQYLARRLRWEDADDLSGLRGAGIHAMRLTGSSHLHSARKAS